MKTHTPQGRFFSYGYPRGTYISCQVSLLFPYRAIMEYPHPHPRGISVKSTPIK